MDRLSRSNGRKAFPANPAMNLSGRSMFRTLFLVLLATLIPGPTTASAFQSLSKVQADDQAVPAEAVTYEKAEQAVELGDVHWQADFDAALSQAADRDLPVFALFQEIPGCSTCQRFGSSPLSHPLVVEAIETYFVPTVVYNNRGGKHAELLRRFREPAWNNPVVRFLDADGNDIIPRKDRVWTTGKLAARIAEALRQRQVDAPRWLQAIVDEGRLGQMERATFAMGCYWEGESRLGGIDGVHVTRAGFRDGSEVVSLIYDPQVTDYRTLVETAASFRCATRVFAHSAQQMEVAQQLFPNRVEDAREDLAFRLAGSGEQKYYLQHSWLKHLPLTEIQSTKVNAALRSRQPFVQWLSPRQQSQMKKVAALKKADANALAKLNYQDGLKDLVSFNRKFQAEIAHAN